MKKLALIMAVLLVVFSGCKKDKLEPDGEGIYLGIIGFNDDLTKFDIRKLTSDSKRKRDFTDFIDDLTAKDATALYYADYSALEMMKQYSQPPKLKNVVLVTFSDGRDNASLDLYNPEGFNRREDYRDYVHGKILNEKVHGLSVQAYTIGLKGDQNSTESEIFSSDMNGMASSEENVFLVNDMNQALTKFSEIADALNSTSTSVNMDVLMNGGLDDGQLIRFVFDGAANASSSNLYIEATFRRTNPKSLENITYHGFEKGVSTLSGTQEGVKWHFVFSDLKYTNGNSISQTDINRIKLWVKESDGTWVKDSEFDKQDKPQVTEDKNSALIVLVLDCTTSLGNNDFAKMKNAANRFIEKLAATASDK
ncbi:MAG: hypothetical protein K5867_00710 [Bacteroidales bacterium]|nr:hypothetical protein [Bacteroidales bacterium]